MFGLRTREDKESCTLGLLWLLWRYSWAEKKKGFTEEMHSAVTFSKIKLDI